MSLGVVLPRNPLLTQNTQKQVVVQLLQVSFFLARKSLNITILKFAHIYILWHMDYAFL